MAKAWLLQPERHAVPELVEDGGEGFLAPVAAIDDLASRVVQLLDSPALRQEMGRRGADRVEASFHLETRVRTVEQAYLDVLRDRPEPAR